MEEKIIIDTLKAFIEYYNYREFYNEKYKKMAVDNTDIRAIQGLLNLYQKEKEKNKELKRELEKLENE